MGKRQEPVFCREWQTEWFLSVQGYRTEEKSCILQRSEPACCQWIQRNLKQDPITHCSNMPRATKLAPVWWQKSSILAAKDADIWSLRVAKDCWLLFCKSHYVWCRNWGDLAFRWKAGSMGEGSIRVWGCKQMWLLEHRISSAICLSMSECSFWITRLKDVTRNDYSWIAKKVSDKIDAWVEEATTSCAWKEIVGLDVKVLFLTDACLHLNMLIDFVCTLWWRHIVDVEDYREGPEGKI